MFHHQPTLTHPLFHRWSDLQDRIVLRYHVPLTTVLGVELSLRLLDFCVLSRILVSEQCDNLDPVVCRFAHV
jgi:hypothetical protein